MTKRFQRGFAVFELILVILLVCGLLFGGWYVWHSRKTRQAFDAHNGSTPQVNSFDSCKANAGVIQETYPEVCVSKDGQRFTNPTQKAPDAPSATYLTIKEWGVRMPVIDSIKDLTYVFHNTDVGEYVTFTFTRLQDAGMCQSDVGVAVSRQKTDNKPPYTLDNPQSFSHIGEYYYYQAYGSSPCYDETNQKQADLVKTINGGNMKNAITNTLLNLEAVQ